MAVRRESIILDLEDNASAEALRAAAGLKALDASINKLSGSATRTRAFQNMSRDVDGFGKSLDRTGSSIDSFSGRLGLLGTAAMALGPALLPIGAAAIPAITTLTAGMGAAAGAAGVLLLAFQGVGDAVTAVSDYRLEPTADNLAKVREEMEKLGPAGADFVMAIDRATPALRDLQQTARAGIFPGWERGLDQLMTQLPGVRDFVADLSLTVGELGEASADALVNDADWQEFFDLIGTDGPSALEDFGRATGNVVAGAANLAEALSELTGNRGGLVESSRSFREWAENLENTEGFQEFADYVRESGPQVAEFLSATGEAMLGLAKAAAPWGSAVLPALTATAEAFAAVAESPIGPPLFAAAAGMLAFSKASQLLTPGLARMNNTLGAARTNISGLGRDVTAMSREFGGLGRAQSTALSFMSNTSGAAQRTRGHLAAVGREAARTGPQIAAMGLLASGAADKMDLQNTAMLGLAGSMIGPWGGAAGAAVGLTLDLAQANDDLTASIKAANAAMDSGGLAELTAQAKVLRETLKETTDSDYFGKDIAGSGFMNMIAPLSNARKLMSGLTGETKKAGEALAEIQAQKASLEDLAVALGANRDSAADMAAGVDRAQDAMKALGISSKTLASAQRMGGVEFDFLTGRIRDWIQTAESSEGRTDAVGDAIAQLGAEAISTADSASALSAALEALIAPEQNLIAAQDQLTSSIRHLGDDLSKQSKNLRGNSDAAIQNRAAISDRVTAIQEMIAAEAEAGRGPEVVARSLAKQRQALIESAEAAGLNKRQVEALVNQMNLTPDLVKTVFESAGIDVNEQKARDLYDAYAKLPPKVQTDIDLNGIPESEADISRLQKKYNLTPKQVKTLAALQDNASGPIASILRQLISLDGKTARTTVTNTIRTEYITTNTVITNQASGVRRNMELRADGGEIPGQRQPYGDKVLAMLAPGEEVISNRYGQADRYRRDRAMGLIPAYGDGGTIDLPGYATGGKVYGAPTRRRLPKGGGPETRAYQFANARTERGWALIVRGLNRHEKALDRGAKRIEKSMSRTEKAIDRNRAQLEEWTQKRDALKSQVTGSLTRDWFGGGTGNVWANDTKAGSVAFAEQQWKQQAADAKLLASTIGNLRKNGAGDAFIAEILNSPDPLAAATMFNKGGFKNAQKLFLSATRATASAANSTSAIYADEQRKNVLEIRGLRKDLDRLGDRLDRNHKQAEATRKRESAAKAAGKGARDKR